MLYWIFRVKIEFHPNYLDPVRDSAIGVCGRRKRYTVQSADEKDDYFYNTKF